SERVRRSVSPDAVGASIHYANLAFLAAGKLSVQHMGEFDVSQHRLERAKLYLQYIGHPKEMVECLIGILLRARSRASIQEPELPFSWDKHFEVQISLRGVVQPVATISIEDGAKKLAQHYAEKFAGVYGRG